MTAKTKVTERTLFINEWHAVAKWH